MPIPILPPAPSRTDPANFAVLGDAWVAALPGWTDAVNLFEQNIQISNFTGTSTSSVSVSTGTKTFTATGGKAWFVGQYVSITSNPVTGYQMFGTVSFYSGTSLLVNVTSTSGSGTYDNWIIAPAAPRNSSEVFTDVTTNNLYIDSNFYSKLQSSNPTISLDTTDYLQFIRSTNSLNVVIGGSSKLLVDATDGPQRSNDASSDNGLVRKIQAETIAANAITNAIADTTTTRTGTSTTTIISPKGWADCAFGSPAQTLQIMTASRDIVGSTFTNNTGRPILVMVTMMHGLPNGGQCLYAIKVNGINIAHVQFGDANGGAYGDVSGHAIFVVPNLATYKIENAGLYLASLNYWTEYR